MKRVAAASWVLFLVLMNGCGGSGGGYYPPIGTVDAGADFAAGPGPDLLGVPVFDLAAVASCVDGVRNGAETDTDCGGGTCAPCGSGKSCQKAGDCMSGFCVNQVCQGAPMPTCNDGIRNGAETDVDCGGGTCPACANGKTCASARDCASAYCSGGVCATMGGGNACRNGIKDGNETDVDCGGSCFPCMTTKRCGANADCQSKNCGMGICGQPLAKFGCLSALQCAVQCYSQACVAACQALINTPSGRTFFTDTYRCESNGPCPTANGGVCDVTALNYDYMACQNCVQGQASLGACMGPLFTCFNDG